MEHIQVDLLEMVLIRVNYVQQQCQIVPLVQMLIPVLSVVLHLRSNKILSLTHANRHAQLELIKMDLLMMDQIHAYYVAPWQTVLNVHRALHALNAHHHSF